MWIRTGWPSCTGNFTPAVEEFPETWYFCPEYLQNNLAKTRDWITLMDMQIRKENHLFCKADTLNLK